MTTEVQNLTTQQVADKLVDCCRQGKWEEAYSELYADNIISLEEPGTDWPERLEGMQAVQGKAQQWGTMIEEYHGTEVSDPLVAGDQFSCKMIMDVTFKGAPRSQNEKLCVYKVRDGKIVFEQFFYDVQPPS